MNFSAHNLKSRARAAILAVAGAFVAAGCVHTPPGTSVEIALAKRPDLIRLPATPPPAVAKVRGTQPSLNDSKLEKVADAFTRGGFCMKAGKDNEAIEAFEEVVKLDPTCADAWNSLAVLYEKTGQEKKAMEAFRKAKRSSGNG